ncbi:hypothetical protein ACQPZX_14885 [Actinoplanes sp. CA-142083]|uniref:hypothetical protein n=1 Tax=Actinoplanes sp. CA-142083 TaxID=3239903 RepID=UPI003D8D94BE
MTEQSRYGEVLTSLQNELVQLSTNSRHITVAGATHYTLVSKSKYAAAVTDALRRVARPSESLGDR